MKGSPPLLMPARSFFFVLVDVFKCPSSDWFTLNQLGGNGLPGQITEYQRLGDLYRDLSDSELLGLMQDRQSLTEIAQDVLRAEVSARRLEIPAKSSSVKAPEEQMEPLFPFPGSFAALSSEDCVWEFANEEDAKAAGAMISAAGVYYDLLLPGSRRFDMRAPRLAVLPEDVERAREILSQPIPEEFRQQASTPEDFVTPACPQCRAADPLLETIEPGNTWHCEACGHVWEETN